MHTNTHYIYIYIIKRYLKIVGIDTDTAMNGQEAVQKASKQKYDMILMDIQMPIMDGYLATECIRASITSLNATTPIYALSAFVLPSEKEKVHIHIHIHIHEFYLYQPTIDESYKRYETEIASNTIQ